MSAIHVHCFLSLRARSARGGGWDGGGWDGLLCRERVNAAPAQRLMRFSGAYIE